MSKVYIIQSARHQADVSPAAAYGSLQFILTHSDRMSQSPELYTEKLIRGLENFQPEEDYVLWSGGDPLSLLMAGHALSILDFTYFRYLRYEKADPRKSGSTAFYVPVTVRLD